MKTKKLLLTLLALFCFVQIQADVEINETNFPDENFRNFLKFEMFRNSDVITDAQIACFFIMDVEGKNISNLKGIEYFTALTTLNCPNNQLTSLDISKNTELELFWCNNNLLSSLDVSKNTKLAYFVCSNNQLTSLDVSKNTALTRLGCDNNQLSSLDVSKNTKLTFLYCGNRQLTSLDVSNNTALETLYCNDSQLTSLDVSKNTALTKLYCQQNQLTSLDVSKNTALSLLYCYNNQIKDKAMDALVASLPNANNGMLQIINNENEGNVMTTIQVADAKAKGWTPQYNDGSNWLMYAGVNPKFKLTYIVDDYIYKSYDVEYGQSIIPESAPIKEGYTFLGWSDIPVTMPAHDVKITALFSINSYKLTYLLNGELYKSEILEYNTKIEPAEYSEKKDGYVFEWKDLPKYMPGKDVTVNGEFMPVVANGIILVDGIRYKCLENSEGLAVVALKTFGSGDTWNPAELYSGDIVIPSQVDLGWTKLNVVKIDDRAFIDCQEMTSISLPEGIKSIGNKAFMGCYNIKSIVLPNSLTTIGDDAFHFCSLTSLVLPSSITSIGKLAFAQCRLDVVRSYISNPANIDEYVFLQDFGPGSTTYHYVDAKYVENLYVPEGTKELYQAKTGWKNFQNIKEIDPNNIVFADDRVRKYIVEAGLTEDGTPYYPLWGIPIVTKWDSNGDGELSYTEAAAITDIGQVFGWIANFANIHGEYGWWLPVSFDEFQFFTGVKTISNGAFGSISSITLPKSVTTIEEGALSGLSCVSVDEENPSFAMINNALCTKDGSQLIKASSNNIEGEYTIPSTVKNILVEAFSNCYNMTSIIIPSSVSSIGNSAFSLCSGLTTVAIHNGVETIGSNAFQDCLNIESINIPQSVKNIGDGFLINCKSLNSIIVEENNENYDSRDNCNAVIQTSTNRLIAGCKSTVIPNTVTEIGNSAFNGCEGLINISIPDGVTYIGNSAFNGCEGLINISIPDGVTYIGIGAFWGCIGLSSINIPDGITSIEKWSFYNTDLNSVKIPNSVSRIEDGAFNSCQNLETVIIGSGIQSISQNAFVGNNLTDVYCYATTVPNAETNSFWPIESIALHVPAGTVDLYKASEPWKNFKKIVEITNYVYTLTYKVDDVVYKTYELEDGATITPEADPERETYKFSGWSEIPETMPAKDVTITGTFERYFTIGNVVRLVNFIINENASSSEVELYDQNNDGELNIGDIILVVKWILNNDNVGASNFRTRTYDVPDLSQYTAAQFDVKTADTNIREIKLVKGMEQTHQLMYQQKDANTYTVVVYSLSNQLMKPENGGIVEIDTDNGSQNGLSVENVIVALPTGATRSFNGGQMTTSIQQIESDGGPSVVYDLKGNRMNGNRGLKNGVYIVNGKKVIVK